MRTSFFSGFKNRFWKTSTALEVAKFAMYLVVPIFASVIYADPKVMKELILKLNYVEYPKAQTKLPTLEEAQKEIQDQIKKD
mmetsp:Transcript_5249/g.10627  ORF Transcript_5249/g.10627 Transcript_5249/m.10627 type:complete len:82 (+) Transcript_5249:43-288(+)